MGSPKANNIRQLAIDLHLNGETNQAIFRILLGSVNERTIRRWVQQFNESGKKTSLPSSGRPITVSTHVIKRRVKYLVKTHSLRQISRKLSISLGSVSKIVKDLKLKVTILLYKYSFFGFLCLCFN